MVWIPITLLVFFLLILGGSWQTSVLTERSDGCPVAMLHAVCWKRIVGFSIRKKRDSIVISGVLFGRSFDLPQRKRSVRVDSKKDTHPPKKRKTISFPTLFRPMSKPVLRSILRIVGTIKLERLFATGSIGTGDPAQTGQVFGVVSALSGFGHPCIDVDICPDFTQKRLEGQIGLVFRFILIVLVLRLIHFSLIFGFDQLKRGQSIKRRSHGNR